MNVLTVIDNFVPPSVERTGLRGIAALLRRLAARGCNLHVLTSVSRYADPTWPRWVADMQGAGLTIHARPQPLRRWPRLGFLIERFSSAFEVMKLQRTVRFDIIHEFSSLPLLANRTALYGCFDAVTIHSLITDNETWLANPGWCVRWPDLVLCAGRLDYEALARRRGHAAAYMPIGIDLAPVKEAVRAATPRDLRKPVVLYIGPLDDRKGAGALTAAAPTILRQCQGARLVVVTQGMSGPGYDYPRARDRFLAGLGEFRASVELHEGERDIPALLAQADIYVHPLTTMHGTLHQPATLLEAMAAGLAVVSSDLPGIRDIITPEVDGLLAPPGDSERLAGCIVALLQDSELRAALGDRAKQRSEAYDLEACADELLDHYCAMLE